MLQEFIEKKIEKAVYAGSSSYSSEAFSFNEKVGPCYFALYVDHSNLASSTRTHRLFANSWTVQKRP